MKNIKALNIDNKDHLTKVIQNKHNPQKQTLQQNITTINKRYDEYEKLINENDLFNIEESPFDENTKNSLLHCYSSKTTYTKEIIKQIKENINNQLFDHCPYCGLFFSHSIDHYLPQDNFPEFIIFEKNLITSCPHCNTIKNRYWKENDSRGILNFYVDKIPEIQFLYCNITFNRSNIPSFNFLLHFSSDFSLKIKKIIEYHYKKLNLLELYKKKINSFISEINHDIISQSKILEFNIIKNLLNIKLANLIEMFGINNYKSVVLSKITSSDEYIEKITLTNALTSDNESVE